jgi:hypothetical protein
MAACKVIPWGPPPSVCCDFGGGGGLWALAGGAGVDGKEGGRGEIERNEKSGERTRAGLGSRWSGRGQVSIDTVPEFVSLLVICMTAQIYCVL